MTVRRTVHYPNGMWRVVSFDVPAAMWLRIRLAHLMGRV